MSTIRFKFKQKLNEVFIIEPNDLGFSFLNYWYKKLTAPLKIAPFIFLVPLSLIAATLLYFLLRHFLVGLVTLLQYGF